MIRSAILFAFLAFLVACGNDHPTTNDQHHPVDITHTQLIEMKGPCDTANQILNCAQVRLKFPEIGNGDHLLRQPLQKWVDNFLLGILDGGLPAEEVIGSPSKNEMVGRFIEMQQQIATEMPELMAWYTAEVTDTVLLNDGRWLSVALYGYTNTGGAHPNSYCAAATFDTATGKELGLSEVISDPEALKAIAEKHYRRANPEAFADGFDFGPEWPFELPSAFCLTADGLYLSYMPYEVAPYSMGAVEFVIPFSELNEMALIDWQQPL